MQTRAQHEIAGASFVEFIQKSAPLLRSSVILIKRERESVSWLPHMIHSTRLFHFFFFQVLIGLVGFLGRNHEFQITSEFRS